MSTYEATTGRAAARARVSGTAALACAGIGFAAAGAIQIARGGDNASKLHTTAEYAIVVAFGVAMLALIPGVRALGMRARGRVGTVASLALQAAAAGFGVVAIVGVATGDLDRLGPLYPIAALVSFVAVVALAVALVRTAEVPRWVGPVLAVAWLGAGPFAASIGLMVVLGAVLLAVAWATRERL